MELTGPATFEDWQSSWKVYENSLLMLGTVDLGTLQLYHNHIQDLHRLYTSKTWLQLYQTDVRARSEHTCRIRRVLVADYERAIAAGLSHHYDPQRSWNSVFEALLKDTTWWNQEFERPALMINARLANPSATLGGDAPVNPVSRPAPVLSLGPQQPAKPRQPAPSSSGRGINPRVNSVAN